MTKRNSKSQESIYIDNLLENDLNLRKRVIYLNDDITELTLDFVQKALDHFETHASEKPVTIEISSYGGCVYSMFGVVDRIKSSPCKIITRVMGKAMSAATFIFAAGDERYIGRNSWLMFHQLSSREYGRHEELVNVVGHNDALQTQMYKLYEEFTGVAANQWKRWCKKDYYMNSETAIKFGIADKFIGE